MQMRVFQKRTGVYSWRSMPAFMPRTMEQHISFGLCAAQRCFTWSRGRPRKSVWCQMSRRGKSLYSWRGSRLTKSSLSVCFVICSRTGTWMIRAVWKDERREVLKMTVYERLSACCDDKNRDFQRQYSSIGLSKKFQQKRVNPHK